MRVVISYCFFLFRLSVLFAVEVCIMDLINDEPRQHPKPVPFCQTSLLQPTVPEVSLLLQQTFEKPSEKKNDSFTGTEFQTYNSWRWKHKNLLNNNTSTLEPKKGKKPAASKDFFLIKDKYCTSDVEKRKNEILYGDSDEPRRPLPPRASPVMPSCIESFFSDLSCDDFKPVSIAQETQNKTLNPVHADQKVLSGYFSQTCFKKELNNSEQLYSIISEQNKQLQVLQNQIQQLLKLQEVKDKQIEQLLKSQESKENKIKQLIQSLDTKGNEVGQLTDSKEKLEQNLQELLKTQENFQKENLNLQRKLNEVRQKNVCSVSVMACVQLTDASTYTNLDDIAREFGSKKSNSAAEENISCIRGGSQFDEKDKSLSLHSADLPVIQENAPSPQSSIHVDIQDFPDSEDDSESESGIPSNRLSALNEPESGPLGYTFYNKILTQLNGIIQNSGEKEITGKKSERQVCKPATDYNFSVERQSPVQSSPSWDVPKKENIRCDSNGQDRNERLSGEIQNICLKDTNSPSDVSLKINALAMKYLKQEQISELGLQAHVPGPCQRDVTIYNVTNLSFGSMRYLDRYQMLPKVRDSQKPVVNLPKNENSPAEYLQRKKRLTIEENMTSVGNILDMTAINQQPKLL